MCDKHGMPHTTYALIMAGGAGTRFWPASRKHRPKQLLALAGEEVLLRQTIDRILPICGMERIYIATGQHLVDATLAAVPHLEHANLLIEPVGRNTAPCIGWAAAHVARRDPDAVIMVLPSDHHITDVERFRDKLELSVEHARTGVITTIGVRPTRPETGYGYIEAAPGPGPVHDVLRFIEKPDLETAKTFLELGTFYWNAGMFFFRAGDMLAAIAEHLPALSEGLRELDRAAAADREAEEVARLFPEFPAISIDTGVIEKMGQLAVVPGDFGWSDIGSWLAAAELATRDDDANSAPQGSVLVASAGNYVVDMRGSSKKRVIALVGVCDLVIVETDDALLVAHRDASQRVRDVVGVLGERGDD
ncbi:MAG TPA: mannose-1-phosphate guanylyltransferase, partial [Polyangiaceae bacterium]|nr:mannose-1-phosphate guanylyltransferase [Polyangiaceae bacterium]